MTVSLLRYVHERADLVFCISVFKTLYYLRSTYVVYLRSVSKHYILISKANKIHLEFGLSFPKRYTILSASAPEVSYIVPL